MFQRSKNHGNLTTERPLIVKSIELYRKTKLQATDCHYYCTDITIISNITDQYVIVSVSQAPVVHRADKQYWSLCR